MKILYLALIGLIGTTYSQFVTHSAHVYYTLWHLPDTKGEWIVDGMPQLEPQQYYVSKMVKAFSVYRAGHTNYMIEVLNGVAAELERREWCNLKVPDVTNVLNETILDRHYEGTVTYSNGFVSRMQHIDIRQSGIDQVWTWNATEETGTVLVRGTMRFTDITIGYDVLADLDDGSHRYTVAITVPLVLFTFNIRRNVNTEAVAIEVTGSVNARADIRTVQFLPYDHTADVLTALINFQMPEAGILAWAEDVFAPITLDVYNKVQFPTICYDCPLAATK